MPVIDNLQKPFTIRNYIIEIMIALAVVAVAIATCLSQGG